MNLTIASHDLYPDPGSGGTGRYVYETARRLVDRGHDVTVVTRRRGDVPRREPIAGIDVRRYDLSIAETDAPEILSRLPRAARVVARHVPADPDVLSFQGPVTSLLAARAVDDDVPRRSTFHSPWPTEYLLRTRDADRSAPRRRVNVVLRDRLERRLLGSVEEVGVLSEYMREQLRARYDPKAPTTVIPGGVDTEVFTPDAAREDVFDSDGPALLTVRRLSPRMGHGLLLDAFATVREQLPDAHLYIAGDGPLADRLRRRAVELGVDDATTFMGYVPDEDLPAAYASADLFVLPTRDLEGFGLATLEAFASGTPVVGTPVGGTVDLVGDFQECVDVPLDMLLSSEDADALASRLVDWLTLDPSTRRRAGEACHAHANDRYAWERIVDALERRYHAVASGEDSRSRGPEQSLVDS